MQILVFSSKDHGGESSEAIGSTSPSATKIVRSVRRVHRPTTEVVYDVETSTRNFALANGAIAHNSAGGHLRFARQTEYQEILELQGKPPNAARTDPKKALANKAVANLLTAIGYDPTKKEFSSRVDRVYLLADADPDGPLHPQTLVQTPQGPTTIEKLFEQGGSNRQVMSSYGGHVAAAAAPRVYPVPVSHQDPELRPFLIKLRDDTEICCTANHQWLVEKEWVRTDHLRPGQVLSSYLLQDTHQVSLHPSTIISVAPDTAQEPTYYYCATVPATGNYLVQGASGQGIVTHNSHIRLLILTLLWKYVPKLIEEGRVYVVDAPLFFSVHQGKEYVGKTLKELQEALPKGAKAEIVRAKGWGEVEPEWVKYIAFDPATRKVFRVLPPVSSADQERFDLIVGDDPVARKQILGLTSTTEAKAEG